MLPARVKLQQLQSSTSSTPQPTTTEIPPSSPRPLSSASLDDDDNDDDVEDLLTSFLPHLYPDEAPSCLGEPGRTMVYASGVWGDVRVMVPDYPKGVGDEGRQDGIEEGRRLFAHYLWGAGLVVAEGIERATKTLLLCGNDAGGDRDIIWNVKGEKVLELGA
ncbi:hypothetical protein ACJ72_08735, partial [Emergomyces africanus]